MKILRVLLVTCVLLVSFSSYAERVDINSADVKTIAKNIKGIGVKKAQAIVAYRNEHGNFSRVEELSKVKGIGNKIVEKNKDSLFINAHESSGSQ